MRGIPMAVVRHAQPGPLVASALLLRAPAAATERAQERSDVEPDFAALPDVEAT